MYQIFIDLTQAISQIITIVISCLGVWIAYKTFLKTPEQQPTFNTPSRTLSTKSSIPSIDFEVSTELLVFQTKNQSTKLISTVNGLECHLFDLRQGKESGLQWQLSTDEIKEVLEKKDYFVNPGFRIKSGDFSIGPRKKWLYSKTLFPNPEKLRRRLETILQASAKN